MAQRDTRTNQEIRIPTLGGLNERPSPANLRPGEFSHLEGLFPKQIGLLGRVPGKVLMEGVEGRVLAIHPTYNVNQDVIIQTDAPALHVFTLDALRERETIPDLTFPDLTEEEDMSMAIIVQMENNNTPGGSGQGFLSGSDTAVANTYYGRRLTDMLVNESSTVTTFTASTGGTGAASTEGTFTLSTGEYRISIQARHNLTAVSSAMVGLYNVTDGAFEVFSGTTTPVLATPLYAPGAAQGNTLAVIDAAITVSGSNKDFSIRHSCTAQAVVRDVTFCGFQFAGTTANVNAAAAKEIYCYVKILKVA